MTTYQSPDFDIALHETERASMPATLNDPPWGEAREAAAREVVEQIEVHVGCQLGGRLRDFRVLFRDNGLVLQGHTQTYYAKQLAQHAVMQTTDLPIRANEIEVSKSVPLTGG